MFRVLVADDRAIVRTGLESLIASLEGMEVVGTASTSAQCVRLAEQLHPDVAVVGFGATAYESVDTARLLRRAAPTMGLLLLAQDQDETTVFPALRVGARGFLLQDANPEEICCAIRLVATGGAVFCHTVAPSVVRYLADSRPVTPMSAFDELTARELQTLELIAHGLTNAEIATRLGQSAKTVSNNVSKLLLKVHVPDRARLLLLALDAGLGRSPRVHTSYQPGTEPPGSGQRGA
ncbi:MAG: response regulator transcription factor [Trueperaceae bacterium]